jgi:hypothetical protein
MYHYVCGSTHNLQPANSYSARNSPKIASVVHPEDGRLTPETCKGLRHNKVIVKVKSVLRGLRYCGCIIVQYSLYFLPLGNFNLKVS